MTPRHQKVSQEKGGRTGLEMLAGHLPAALMDFDLESEIAQLH